jgi:hypothetical protein
MMRAVIELIIDNDISNMEETFVHCGYIRNWYLVFYVLVMQILSHMEIILNFTSSLMKIILNFTSSS